MSMIKLLHFLYLLTTNHPHVFLLKKRLDHERILIPTKSPTNLDELSIHTIKPAPSHHNIDASLLEAFLNSNKGISS